MSQNRVFFPQQALDQWLEEGRIALVGDELTASAEGRRFGLQSAVRFMSEVTTGEDPNDLVGKVKSLEALQALGAEHCPGSVIVGDNAYEVIDGFLGELLPGKGRTSSRKSGSVAAPFDALAHVLGRTAPP